MYKVFLGGSCVGDNWRSELIPFINIKYFNPFVENWTPECKYIEDEEKEIKCNVHLYVLTTPKSIYSIAEAVDSVHSKKITILHIIPDNFSDIEIIHMKAIMTIVKNNGGICYIDRDLYRSSRVINNCFE